LHIMVLRQRDVLSVALQGQGRNPWTAFTFR
jgi:hypothetical protein